ncbi:MAG: hypothetical protein QXO16_04010 [Archaeoglobaceae archaeon]
MRWVKLLIALSLMLANPIVAVAHKEGGQGIQFDNENMMGGGMMNHMGGMTPGMGAGMNGMMNENRERMMNWVHNCEEWMERLREKVNASNMNETTKLKIQERIKNVEQQMEQIKLKIQNAKDYNELRNAMKESSKMWMNMSKEMRKIACEHATEKARDIIERLNDLADRFESAGLDVTNLRNAINEANDTLNSIEAKLSSGQEVTSQEFRELKLDIEKAFLEAKKLAREYKPAPEIGIVHAKVNGNFTLDGKMVVLIRGNGTLSATGDSVASAKGTTAMVLRGNVTASGEGDFVIVTHGNGTLFMSGIGSYAYKRCVNEKFTTGNFTDSVTITFGC